MSQQPTREELQTQFGIWDLFKLDRSKPLSGSKKQIAKRVVFEFVFRQDIADQAVVYQRLYSCRSLWEFRETLRNIEIYNPTRDQRAAIDDALVKAFDAVTVALGVVLSLIKPTNDSTGEISDDENSLQFPASEEKMLSVD